LCTHGQYPPIGKRADPIYLELKLPVLNLFCFFVYLIMAEPLESIQDGFYIIEVSDARVFVIRCPKCHGALTSAKTAAVRSLYRDA
jgi:hypothetical protein